MPQVVPPVIEKCILFSYIGGSIQAQTLSEKSPFAFVSDDVLAVICNYTDLLARLPTQDFVQLS